MGKKRSTSAIGNASKKRQKVNKRKLRENEAFRVAEQARDTGARRVRRESPVVRAAEQARNTGERRVCRNTNDWEKLVTMYEKNIKDGPFHNCYSCDRLYFKTQIKTISKEKLKQKGCSEEFLSEVVLSSVLDQDEYQFCTTCYKNLAMTPPKYPKYNINKSELAFPKIPDIVKNLTPLEERLVAPRIPFMKIFALGCDRQYGIKGGVVNVPVDVPVMFTSIPIRPEQTGTIHLKLKRQMALQSHYQYERIRPSAVFEAGQLLVKTPLFVSENITLNNDWQQENNEIFNVDLNEGNLY